MHLRIHVIAWGKILHEECNIVTGLHRLKCDERIENQIMAVNSGPVHQMSLKNAPTNLPLHSYNTAELTMDILYQN